MGEQREPPYLIDYTHKGERWCFEIWAESWEDAEQRLRAIKHNGEVIGSNVQMAPNGQRPSLAADNSKPHPLAETDEKVPPK